jgi:NAD(P)-dependent dehydrogenase (short-subunit alcohol dehydrogenase family)
MEIYIYMEIRGKGVLIVGSKRIGAIIAKHLSKNGMHIAIGYRHSIDEAESLKNELNNSTGTVILVHGDILVEDDIKNMLQTTKEQLGDLTFLINLASDFPRTPFNELNESTWENSMNIAKGNYLLNLYASKMFFNNPGPVSGHIIQFSDWAVGETPYKDYLPYLTSKAAIDFMTRCFALELAEHSILVNSIAPGPTIKPPEITTEIWRREVISRTPLQRESSAQDIAEVVLALLRSETITGETIRIDAGRHLIGSG